MTGEPAPTLGAVLAETAALLEGLVTFEVAGPAGTIEWRLDGVTLAALGAGSAGSAEFRLRREVAAAALRTPGVTASPRGAGWVRFAPSGIDAYAADRARAWLQSAWRYVDELAAGDPGEAGEPGDAGEPGED